MRKSVESLSPQERAAYYRDRAAESLRLATIANDQDAKASFVDNAARWLTLAVEVESFYQRLADGPIKQETLRLVQ